MGSVRSYIGGYGGYAKVAIRAYYGKCQHNPSALVAYATRCNTCALQEV